MNEDILTFIVIVVGVLVVWALVSDTPSIAPHDHPPRDADYWGPEA